MKYLILGDGFIASELVRKIESDRCLQLSRNASLDKSVVRHDFNLSAELPAIAHEFAPDVVVNTVWNEVGNYSDENNLQNLKLQRKIIQGLGDLRHVGRVINMGSCWELTNVGSNNVALSKQQLNFVDTKLKIKSEFANSFGDLSIWGIIFYVYGESARKGLLKYVLECVLNGSEIKLNKPNMCVDYIHVTDVAQAIIELSSHGGSSQVQLGTGIGYTVKEFVKKTLEIVRPGEDDLSVIFPEESPAETLVADTRTVSNMQWFRSKLSLSDGLSSCI